MHLKFLRAVCLITNIEFIKGSDKFNMDNMQILSINLTVTWI